MKSFLIALLSVLFCGVATSAQSTLLATLNHEGTITTFYGATALQQAHEAAVAGDIINLSSGTFVGVNITKAVTIRGAGMTVDTETRTEPTVISTDFTINVANDETNGDHTLTLEGIYSDQYIRISYLENAMFLKCRFGNITYGNSTSSSTFKDLNFIHCRVAKGISVPNNSSASFIGCVIEDVYAYNNVYLSFNNCAMKDASIPTSEFRNCIIISSNMGSSSSTYYNNLHINGNPQSCYLTKNNSTNKGILQSDELVKSLVGDYSDDNTYELNDELRALIQGTDGTEIGLYGGNLPYDPTPTNPQIKKFNVASKTTADGKLSVDIEVSSAE